MIKKLLLLLILYPFLVLGNPTHYCGMNAVGCDKFNLQEVWNVFFQTGGQQTFHYSDIKGNFGVADARVYPVSCMIYYQNLNRPDQVLEISSFITGVVWHNSNEYIPANTFGFIHFVQIDPSENPSENNTMSMELSGVDGDTYLDQYAMVSIQCFQPLGENETN